MYRPGRFFGILREQFDAEAAQSGTAQNFEKSGPGLGAPIEERVPAADIGGEAVQLPNPVAKVHFVFVTGTTAVRRVSPVGKKGAEDAVLHMKHRHVLMQSQLEPFRRRDMQQIDDLLDVEIVGDSEVLKARFH